MKGKINVKCCPKTVIRPTSVDVKTGTSVTVVLPTLLTIDILETKCFRVEIPKPILPIVGTEEVIINIGGTALAALDNRGMIVTAQMLRRAIPGGCHVKNPVYVLQIGFLATENVVYFRRGLNCRRTTVAVTAPPTP